MISTHTPRYKYQMSLVMFQIMYMGIGGKMTWTSSYNKVSVFDESEQTKIQTRLAWISPHTTKNINYLL